MAAMEENIESLSLVDEEGDGFVFGRFLSDRPIRTNIMVDRLASIWRPGRGVSIKEKETGLFLFQFFHQIDKERVFKGGLWSFDNHCDMIFTMPVDNGERN